MTGPFSVIHPGGYGSYGPEPGYNTIDLAASSVAAVLTGPHPVKPRRRPGSITAGVADRARKERGPRQRPPREGRFHASRVSIQRAVMAARVASKRRRGRNSKTGQMLLASGEALKHGLADLRFGAGHVPNAELIHLTLKIGVGGPMGLPQIDEFHLKSQRCRYAS